MTVASHLVELRKKHDSLTEMVEQAQRSPAVDDLKIAELKKQKLRIKEEMAQLCRSADRKKPETACGRHCAPCPPCRNVPEPRDAHLAFRKPLPHCRRFFPLTGCSPLTGLSPLTDCRLPRFQTARIGLAFRHGQARDRCRPPDSDAPT